MSFFTEAFIAELTKSVNKDKRLNEQKNTPAPSEKVKITETVKDESEKEAVKSEPNISSDEQIKWIELALKYLAKELPYAFPPKVNEKPVVILSNSNKMVIVCFVPQNQLYASANVVFDFNTKERIVVFVTTVALEKVGITIAGQELTEKFSSENEDTKEFAGKNFESLKYRSMHEGDPEATYMLGLVYEKGLFGKEKNYVKARKYYERAAKWGNEKAQEKIKAKRRVKT